MITVPAAQATLADWDVTVAQLAASLLPGTPVPYRAPTMSDERRHELDALARIERVESTAAIGESPAPYHLDIADLLVAALHAAYSLARDVARAAEVVPGGLSSFSVYADPRPAIGFARAHLHTAESRMSGIAPYAHDVAVHQISRAAPALGLIPDGQTLVAICPWCQGRTEHTPVGGAHTLRVRVLPGGEAAILCESGTCEPPSKDVGTWWRGKPAWPRREWDWLADRLAHSPDE